VRSGPGKPAKNKKKKKRKKRYSGQQQKEMNCDEPRPAPNEKTQGIQRTKRPTGALVAAASLRPRVWRLSKFAPPPGLDTYRVGSLSKFAPPPRLVTYRVGSLSTFAPPALPGTHHVTPTPCPVSSTVKVLVFFFSLTGLSLIIVSLLADLTIFEQRFLYGNSSSEGSYVGALEDIQVGGDYFWF